MKKVAIIGAGVSGLYLANLLEKENDFEYKIFEKRTKLNLEEGYGIQLSVNSIKLLNKIGFKNLSAYDLSCPKRVNFIDAKNNKKICDIDISKFNDETNFYTTLKRKTLINFLLEAIPEKKINHNFIMNDKNSIFKTCMKVPVYKGTKIPMIIAGKFQQEYLKIL